MKRTRVAGLLAVTLLASGCWHSLGAGRSRRIAGRPEPSRERTTSSGCVDGLAARGGVAYWSEYGRIMRWDTRSASVPAVFREVERPRAVAVDAVQVYWLADIDDGARRELHRARIDGTRVEVVTPTTDRADMLVAADTGIYWLGRAASSRAPVGLWRIAAGARAPERICNVAADARELAVGGGVVWWDQWDPHTTTGSVWRMTLPEGAPELVPGSGAASGLVADARGAAWRDGDEIMHAAASGDAQPLASVAYGGLGLALTNDEVYALSHEALVAVARDGGRVRRVAAIDVRAKYLAITADEVFVAGGAFFPHSGCLGSEVQRVAQPTKPH